MSRQSAGVEPSVPNGDDERVVRDYERAGEVYCIGAPEAMLGGEFTGVTLDRRRQLNGSRCPPELLPCLSGLLEAVSVEITVPIGGSESCANLGVREPARHGCVAPIPQRHSEFRPRFFNEQLHERTGVEVDDGHLSDVAR